MINVKLFKVQEVVDIVQKLPQLSQVVLAMTPEGTVKTEKEDHLSEGSTSDHEKTARTDDQIKDQVIPEEDEYQSCDEELTGA